MYIIVYIIIYLYFCIYIELYETNILLKYITRANLVLRVCTRNMNSATYIQGRLKEGANRAIARGPKFWGAHEIFEKKMLLFI